MLELEASIPACFPSDWGDFPHLQKSILTPHGNSVCLSPNHCVPRSGCRLGAQAEPWCVTSASHSTSVNLSFFVFNVKKIRESLWGPLCTSPDTHRGKGVLESNPGVTIHGRPWLLLCPSLLTPMALFFWPAACEKDDPPDLCVSLRFNPPRDQG